MFRHVKVALALFVSTWALMGCTYVHSSSEGRPAATEPSIVKISFIGAGSETWSDGGLRRSLDHTQAEWSVGTADSATISKAATVFNSIEKQDKPDASPSATATCKTPPCSPDSSFSISAILQVFHSTFSAEPSALMKSIIKVGHLVGIILGLGAATVLDLIVLRFLLAGKVKSEHVHLIEFMTQIVTAGLVILWLSGLSYLFHYAMFDPSKLTNQKVWAKIAIVVVLTINGYFIHSSVVPLIKKQVGRALFAGLPRRECGLMLAFGTISATSWYVPLILGAMPHFNFVVPASGLLGAYAILLLIAIASTQGIVHAIKRNKLSPEAQASYDVMMRRVSATVVRVKFDASSNVAAAMHRSPQLSLAS